MCGEACGGHYVLNYTFFLKVAYDRNYGLVKTSSLSINHEEEKSLLLSQYDLDK